MKYCPNIPGQTGGIKLKLEALSLEIPVGLGKPAGGLLGRGDPLQGGVAGHIRGGGGQSLELSGRTHGLQWRAYTLQREGKRGEKRIRA